MAQTQIFRGTARSIITVNGARHYAYHRTAVVIVNANGSIRLDSGGYRTNTTRTAMNQASNQDELGFRVFQEKGDWFVNWKGEKRQYADGMILSDIPAEIAPVAEDLEFTRVTSDTCGNPRYVVHFLNLNTQEETDNTPNDWNRISTLYAMACKRANSIGGAKYRGKDYGGGIVFQSYSIDETAKSIARVTGRTFKAIK